MNTPLVYRIGGALIPPKHTQSQKSFNIPCSNHTVLTDYGDNYYFILMKRVLVLVFITCVDIIISMSYNNLSSYYVFDISSPNYVSHWMV